MDNELAKYILSELASIRFYKKRIKELEDTLDEIAQEIYDIQTPSSPSGGDGVKISAHRDKASIVNEKLTDEQNCIADKNHMITCLTKANAYMTKLLLVCDEQDTYFVKDYVKDVPRSTMRDRYGYSHPYDHMIRLIKKIKTY